MCTSERKCFLLKMVKNCIPKDISKEFCLYIKYALKLLIANILTEKQKSCWGKKFENLSIDISVIFFDIFYNWNLTNLSGDKINKSLIKLEERITILLVCRGHINKARFFKMSGNYSACLDGRSICCSHIFSFFIPVLRV